MTTEPKWSTTPPEEPGWYWCKEARRDTSEWGGELVSYHVVPALIKKYAYDLQVIMWGQPYSAPLKVDADYEWWPVRIEGRGDE